MPQISKVERERDIKQVSRSDDLKPATEKTINKSIPRIQNKASAKELTEIAEQKETASSMPVTAPIKAARRAGIAAIRHIHVDHFIPWFFVKSDNLWNFVLACPKCNIKKKDSLVNESFIQKLESRNKRLLRESCGFVDSELVADEFRGYSDNLLSKMWEYAKRSGVNVRTELFN